jgi:hypothetical protein
METLNMEIKNTAPILANLLEILQSNTVPAYVYLNRINADQTPDQHASGLKLSTLGINEAQLPEILKLLGIRGIIVNAGYDFCGLAKLTIILPAAEVEQYLWAFFKDETVLKELRSLFSNCRTIAFDDWSAITGASSLWDGLLADVIKPLGRKDLEFIFYLGDPMDKLSFQVDEAIDLISDFSFNGQVTFALDESEAVKLWMVLNGVKPDVSFAGQTPGDLKKKYFSIFRTMDVTRLLIYSANDAILLSKNQQFTLTRKRVDYRIEIGSNARQNFITGFSIGLLKQLDVAHCIALGLIVFGSYGESKASPGLAEIRSYIQRWIEDLQKPESIYLYQ